ncbi:hypothetical protein ACFL3V_00825 [Nanoarchaeota archaeon]
MVKYPVNENTVSRRKTKVRGKNISKGVKAAERNIKKDLAKTTPILLETIKFTYLEPTKASKTDILLPLINYHIQA